MAAADLKPICFDRIEGDRDVSVESAVCKLLMGDVTAAEAALNLGSAAAHTPDPDVTAFIQVLCAANYHNIL